MPRFFKVPLQFAGFFGILIVLLWLQVPFIPGVHGIFQDILDVAAALLFYWAVGLIFKSSAQRKASSHNP